MLQDVNVAVDDFLNKRARSTNPDVDPLLQGCVPFDSDEMVKRFFYKQVGESDEDLAKRILRLQDYCVGFMQYSVPKFAHKMVDLLTTIRYRKTRFFTGGLK